MNNNEGFEPVAPMENSGNAALEMSGLNNQPVIQQPFVQPQINPVNNYVPNPAPPVSAKKKKKPFILQLPVIIALGVVLLALIAYLVFNAFLLHIPQGVIWSAEYENEDGTMITYYFEFREDGNMVTTLGSKEYICCYSDINDKDGKRMIFYYDFLDFYAGYEAAYEITGSRLLHNQEITFTYGEGDTAYSFTLHEVNEKEDPLELPSEFTPDEKLLGEWYYQDPYGYEYHLTFNDDGSMTWIFEGGANEYHYSEIEHYTYTVGDGSVNLTWQIIDSNVRSMEYKVDGDSLSFADMIYMRADDYSTPDEN